MSASAPDHGPAFGVPAAGGSLGQTVGEYRLIQRIGEGGMGVVHLALDRHQRAVAVKVLRPHIAGDPDARVRLAREVETLRRVRHERIAQVLDADVDGPVPFVVTEYVAGSTLDASIRERGPLAPAALVQLGFGLGDALGAIHRAGVVHRDLKPGNVLMVDGAPVVIDFGIAHIADDTRLTMTGLVMGTPGYLSPELIEGGTVERATDWWGWAATMVFAATGRAPFGKGPMEIVLDRVRRGECDLDGVPAALVPVLTAALSPQPEHRPRPGQLRAALIELKQALDDGSADAEPFVGRDREVTQATVILLPRRSAGSTEVMATAETTAQPVSATEVMAEASPTVARPVEPATVLNTVLNVVNETRALPVTDHPAPRPEDRHHTVPQGHQRAHQQPPIHQRVQPLYPQFQQAHSYQQYQPQYRQPAQPQQYQQPVQNPPALYQPAQQVVQQPQQPQQAPDAQPARKSRRFGTIGALLLVFVLCVVMAPVPAVVGFSVLAALARMVDRVNSGLLLRRRDRGRRASDVAYAVFSSPLHLVLGVLWQVLAVLLPGFLAVCAYFATGINNPAQMSEQQWLPLGAAGLVFAVASWWGPGGGSLSRGARSMVRGFAPGRVGAALAVLALLAVVGYLGLVFLQSGGVTNWYPWHASPLDQLVGVRS